MIEASNLRESALIELRRLIGAAQETVIELTDALDQGARGAIGATGASGARDSAELTREAFSQRPERKALTLRIGGIEARQQAAMTGNKPVVAVGAGVDYSNPNQRIFPKSRGTCR